MFETIITAGALAAVFGTPVFINMKTKADNRTARAESERDIATRTLERIKEAAEAIDQELDDPTGDGRGTDSRVPDADAYNDLHATVIQLTTDALARIRA